MAAVRNERNPTWLVSIFSESEERVDRLDAMSLLVDAIDEGSFSAAARRRGLPVATLTRKVGQLEAHLGATLLLRSTRGLTLTDTGRRYVAASRQILAQVTEVERDAAGEFAEPTGRLVVSAPRMFGRLHVLPIVSALLERHSGITVDLQLADGNVDLSAGEADIAVRIGAMPDSDLRATRLGVMRSVIAVSPTLIELHGAPGTLDDLAKLPRVLLDMPLPQAAWKPLAGQARLVVSSAEAAVDAAAAGIGYVRLLHYQVAEAVATGRLSLILEHSETPPVPVHLVHAPLPQLPQKIRRFLDIARDELRGALLSLG